MTTINNVAFNQVSILSWLFREKNALSPENAIELTASLLVDYGMQVMVADPTKMLKLYPFLKQTSDGKVWFDEREYKEYIVVNQKRANKIMKILVYGWLGLMTVLIIGLIFFG